MNAKQIAALCVGLGSTVALAYAVSTNTTNASISAAQSVVPQTSAAQEKQLIQREYRFSETVEAMSCEDQLIMSAATGGPSHTE
jgi:hypothetical protein